MNIAILREVSPAIENCELTHLSRQPINIDLARLQHHAYEQALISLGCQVQCLPVEPGLPDSVFVEDVAVVFDEIAIIARPGADSRRPEITSIAQKLQGYRRLVKIEKPGTLDGGDVLVLGKKVYVGLSGRSNSSAIEQMQTYLLPFGYKVIGVKVSGCLHLKSAVTQLAEDFVLVNPAWVDATVFTGMQRMNIHPQEPYGANALWIGDGVVYPANFPRTQQSAAKILETLGRRFHIVDVSELQKAEGAVTCCSLIIPSKEL
jgi:dimethylargininase